MRKAILVIAMLASASSLFAQSEYLFFGGDFGFAGNVGGNIGYGLSAAPDIYICLSFDSLFTDPKSGLLAGLGARYFPFHTGLLLGLDAGLGDFDTSGADNWCFGIGGVVGYDLGGICPPLGGIQVGIQSHFYFAASVQATFEVFLDLGGPLPSGSARPTDSGPSPSESPGIVPLSPLLQVTDSTEGSVTLQWDAAYGAETYNLYRDGNLIYSGPLTFFVDTGLPSSSKHFYTITARNSAGVSGQSEAVSGIASRKKQTALLPLAPFLLSITDATQSSLTLQWDASSGADTYHLYRNGEVVYSGPLTYFVDTGLASVREMFLHDHCRKRCR